jgi:hypothetical protein
MRSLRMESRIGGAGLEPSSRTACRVAAERRNADTFLHSGHAHDLEHIPPLQAVSQFSGRGTVVAEQLDALTGRRATRP